VDVRFFLELYWHDPSLINASGSSVPDGVWRPENVFVVNSFGPMRRSKPGVDTLSLIDSSSGLLLLSTEYFGKLYNPMALQTFPFDSDSIELHLHQAEDSSRDEYVFRPFADSASEASSVKLFFDPWRTLGEWHVRGFSRSFKETRGSDRGEYSQFCIHLHMTRHWQYYAWKIMLPLLAITLFSFSARVLPPGPSSLAVQQKTHLTMFLSSTALLFVIERLVPKTSYLTLIDKLVIACMCIQFLNAAFTWFSPLLFEEPGADDESEAESATTTASPHDPLALLLLVSMLAIAIANYVLLPARSIVPPNAWPSTLFRGDGTAFHRFVEGCNVFGSPSAGHADPTSLPPKRCADDPAAIPVRLPPPRHIVAAPPALPTPPPRSQQRTAPSGVSDAAYAPLEGQEAVVTEAAEAAEATTSGSGSGGPTHLNGHTSPWVL
jgi:hypothetical protein